MQIHELTRPRKKITEQGFLGGLASGLQSALGKVGVQGPEAGPEDRLTGPTVNRAQALAAQQRTAQILKPVMMKDWSKAVQTAMAQSTDPATGAPPTSVARLTSGEQARLKAGLIMMVNKAISPYGSFDYRRLASNIGDTTTPEGQTIKATAMQAIEDIDQAIDAIFQATLEAKANTSDSWTKLTRDGIAPAQGIQAYDTDSSGTVSVSPAARQLLQRIRLDDGDIVKIRQTIAKPEGTQMARAILDKTTPASAASPLIMRFAEQAKLTPEELASMLTLTQDAANDAAFKEIFGLRA